MASKSLLVLFICTHIIQQYLPPTTCTAAEISTSISRLEDGILDKIKEFKVRYHRSLEAKRIAQRSSPGRGSQGKNNNFLTSFKLIM